MRIEELPEVGGAQGFFLPLPPLERDGPDEVDEDMVEKAYSSKRGTRRACEKRFLANQREAWRKIWCGFFKDCGCNGDGACVIA